MLEYLRIRNLALIEDVELEFSPGLNVLTGETGAGKTFVLKALGFLLGDRLLAEMVRSGAERAQVEALFHLEGEELVMRRELLAESGRSRLYINDTLRSQDSLRELRDRLRETNPAIAELSMGMSGDFELAIAEGATTVRVGQAIFGARRTPDSEYWPGLASEKPADTQP